MDHGTRAWEPGDFFEFPNVDPPLETIEPGLHCLLFGPAAAETRTLEGISTRECSTCATATRARTRRRCSRAFARTPSPRRAST